MNAEIQKSLKEYFEPIGQQLLQEKLSTLNLQTGKIDTRRQDRTKGLRSFQYQLILASGTIVSAFVALSVEKTVFIQLSFACLIASLLFGVFSTFLSFENEETQDLYSQRSAIEEFERSLEFLRKFYFVDTELYEKVNSLQKELIDSQLIVNKRRVDSQNAWLMVTSLTGQRLIDLQVILFTLGVTCLGLSQVCS